MQTAGLLSELTCLIFLGSERTREGSGAGSPAWSTVARAGEWQRQEPAAASHVIMCVAV
jgi:hypothetical protein